MTRVYQSVSILIIIIGTFKAALFCGPSYNYSAATLGRALTDSESRLAMGAKIPLRTADQFDLELIPGISSKLSTNILKRRDEILKYARGKKPSDHAKALEKAHGIGEKSAQKLYRYLDLES